MWHRVFFYGFSLVLFVAAIQWKKRQIIHQRQRPVASLANEWEKYGTPIEITQVDQGPIFATTVLTGQIDQLGLARSYVAKAVQQQLTVNQEVAIKNNGTMGKGVIAKLASAPHPATGMYLVETKISGPSFWKQGDSVRIFARFPKSKQARRLPAAVVLQDQGNYYVWKMADGKVKKEFVTLGATSEEYVQILSGLELADVVARSGFNQLVPNAPVRVFGNN